MSIENSFIDLKEELKKQGQVIVKALRSRDRDKARNSNEFQTDITNISQCMNTLLIREYTDGTFDKTGWRCKNRGCPICQKIKQSKYARNARKLHHLIQQKDLNYKWLSLTLTAIPPTRDYFKQHQKNMEAAFKKLLNSKELNGRVVGYMRFLELSNKKGELYPHYHCLLLVKPSLYEGKYYLKEEEWQRLWTNAMYLPKEHKVDLLLDISLSRIKPNEDALAQAITYAAKPEIRSAYPAQRTQVVEGIIVGLMRLTRNKKTFIASGEVRHLLAELSAKGANELESESAAERRITRKNLHKYDRETGEYCSQKLIW